MHMANELLSVPVAAGTLAIAAGSLGLICRKVRQTLNSEKIALMGILGAFIFAAQMVNIQLPAMPGTSGHMIGTVLLAIILGPHASALVISSVVIVQCLIFQDGGLLALGCNIINMAVFPAYLGYVIYKVITAGGFSSMRAYIGAMAASIISVEAGAILVPLEASFSSVLAVPFTTFLITMTGVHFLIGFVEGLLTVVVLIYLQQVRPDIVFNALPGKIRLSRKMVLVTLLIFSLIIGGAISLFASELPDGLEWSYAERPDQPDFKGTVENKDPRVSAVDDFQSKYSLLPDYSRRSLPLGEAGEITNASAKWTSFAGIIGSLLTMVLIWLIVNFLRKRRAINA